MSSLHFPFEKITVQSQQQKLYKNLFRLNSNAFIVEFEKVFL